MNFARGCSQRRQRHHDVYTHSQGSSCSLALPLGVPSSRRLYTSCIHRQQLHPEKQRGHLVLLSSRRPDHVSVMQRRIRSDTGCTPRRNHFDWLLRSRWRTTRRRGVACTPNQPRQHLPLRQWTSWRRKFSDIMRFTSDCRQFHTKDSLFCGSTTNHSL